MNDVIEIISDKTLMRLTRRESRIRIYIYNVYIYIYIWMIYLYAIVA